MHLIANTNDKGTCNTKLSNFISGTSSCVTALRVCACVCVEAGTVTEVLTVWEVQGHWHGDTTDLLLYSLVPATYRCYNARVACGVGGVGYGVGGVGNGVGRVGNGVGGVGNGVDCVGYGVWDVKWKVWDREFEDWDRMFVVWNIEGVTRNMLERCELKHE